jgi:hypothetical protein
LNGQGKKLRSGFIYRASNCRDQFYSDHLPRAKAIGLWIELLDQEFALLLRVATPQLFLALDSNAPLA